MTVDGLRGASISYNILNLPEEVCLGNEKVSYIYTSAGEKLATRVGSSLTYYRGPLVYSGNNLLYLVHPEGLTRKSTGGYVYYYAKRDHLGSTRVLCHASGNTLVADQTTGYYPFGLAHGHENLNLNRYLFSGKELQDQSLGGKLLGLYDFGSRFYDPTLGRWFNVDPKLEFVSPYGYCANNPVLYVDPNGEDIVLSISKDVKVTVVTRLINVNINVPEWTGAQKLFKTSVTLQGEDVVMAALDLVGIIDPTGIADALSASIYASQGDLINSLISGAGLIPYIGDFAKAFRRNNPIKILSLAVESGAGAAGRGFHSFSAFKRAMENAAEGNQWHHIVGQHADNVRKFGAESIHNTNNLVEIPKELHHKINGHYNSTRFGTQGLTVRDWLKTQSFEAQYEYGMDVLQKALNGTL